MPDGSLMPQPAADAQDNVPITTLRKQFLDWSGAKRDEIEEARVARHYYHGDQYSPEEVKTLKKRRQPIITSNRIAKKINGIVGLIERLRQDPKGFPRTPKHTEGADLSTAVLRYVLDANEFKTKGGDVGRNAGIEGLFGIEIELITGDQGDPDIGMNIVDPDTFFYDPRSFRADFTDARFMGIFKWLDVDEGKEMFPDQAEALDGLMSSGGDMDSGAQRDREAKWIDTDKKRIRLVEHWYITGGQWFFCFYVGSTELMRGPSFLKDEKGKTMCRFIMGSAYVDHDGDRYGLVRNLKSPQDEINARRSKALHIMNTRRIIAEQGAVKDIEKARIESARPDGYIEVNPGRKFEYDDASKAADLQSQLVLLTESKDEIENFGPNPALIGQGVENKSGRAIALMQQAGIAELGPFIIGWRGWKLRVYRAIWNAVQQHWQGERWVRVTDSQDVAQFIQVNGVQLDPHTGQPQMVNAIGSLDVDIILDEGPDSVNMMADVFDTLQSLAASGQQVPIELVIKMSGLPESVQQDWLNIIKQAQQPDPQKIEAQQVALDQEKSKTTLNQSSAIKNLADAGAKHADAHGSYVDAGMRQFETAATAAPQDGNGAPLRPTPSFAGPIQPPSYQDDPNPQAMYAA